MHSAILRFLILGSLLLTFQSGDCFAQDSNGTVSASAVATAIQTLKDTKAMPDLMNGFGATNKAEYLQCLAIYHKQMDAIVVLGRAKVPGTANLLLPYLDYPTQAFPVVRWGGMHSMEQSVTDMEKLWPVLGSLMEIPGSSQALANYALDQRNPVNSRFAAFHALRYVDKNQMKLAGDALDVEFSGSKRAKGFVSWIEDDKQAHPYMGTMWIHGISK